MTVKVTRTTVEKYLERNFPHLALYENRMNGDKGWYWKDKGPAASFTARGKTWRAVLAALYAD